MTLFEISTYSIKEKQNLIRHCDTKASVLLVLCGILITGFMNIYTSIKCNELRSILTILFFIILSVVIFFCIWGVLLPRIKSIGSSMLDIDPQECSDTFVKQQKNKLEDDWIIEIIIQNNILADILHKKNRNLRNAFISMSVLFSIYIFASLLSLL